VVGTRTWGGVIGVDLKYELVDGTLVAQPKYAWWFTPRERPERPDGEPSRPLTIFSVAFW
jgi:hypothetical protein